MTTATSITVRVPLAIRHRPGRKTVVTPMIGGMAPVTTRADPTLARIIHQCWRTWCKPLIGHRIRLRDQNPADFGAHARQG